MFVIVVCCLCVLVAELLQLCINIHFQPLVYTDENVTFKEQILCQELQMTQNEERQLPRVQAFVSQRPEHSGLIPVVTRTAVITPTSRCPWWESQAINPIDLFLTSSVRKLWC